jgi:preprotein translocase subunit SecE
MSRFIQYLKDTKGEFKHVSWPTNKQTTIFTVLVILISLLTAAFLGFFDFVFTNIFSKFFL